MTKDLFTSLETFVSRLRQTHPTLRVSCDVPDSPNGSTWIDIRAGQEWIVVEYHPDLGFGFSEPGVKDVHLYGTPSAVFIGSAQDALAHLDARLEKMATVERRGENAAPHDA